MEEKVKLGNRHAQWLAHLLQVCIELKIHFWVENPDGSFLWYLDEFVELGARTASQVFPFGLLHTGDQVAQALSFFDEHSSARTEVLVQS